MIRFKIKVGPVFLDPRGSVEATVFVPLGHPIKAHRFNGGITEQPSRNSPAGTTDKPTRAIRCHTNRSEKGRRRTQFDRNRTTAGEVGFCRFLCVGFPRFRYRFPTIKNTCDDLFKRRSPNGNAVEDGLSSLRDSIEFHVVYPTVETVGYYRPSLPGLRPVSRVMLATCVRLAM